MADPKRCRECGAIIPEGAEKCKCGAELPPPTLEDYGFTVRHAENGGGFLLYQGNKAVDQISESKKGLTAQAAKYSVDEELLRNAIITAKATPKPKVDKKDKPEPDPRAYQIITDSINRIAPDSGVVNGLAYVGMWLPCKIIDPETGVTEIKQIFHLIWSNGTIQAADPRLLSAKGLYLTTDPIFQHPRISIRIATKITEIATPPNQTYVKILTELMKYIEFSDSRLYHLVTVWLIGTYLYKRFAAYPYLQLNSVKRAGKTKLLTFLSLLSYNSVFTMNMSPSSLFRLVQSMGATVLMDETEDLNDPERKGDIRALLLSGYKRGGCAYRSEKGENEKQTPTPFEIYSPKAVASIKGLEDVLEDRCVSIIMKRGKNAAIVNREIPFESPVWEEIRAELTHFYLANHTELENIYENLNSVVSDVNVVSVVSTEAQREKISKILSRDWELWRPLLTISYFFRGVSPPQETTLTTQTTLTTLNTFDLILDLAVESVAERKMENSTDTTDANILQALLEIVTTDNYYDTKKIIAQIVKIRDEPEAPGWLNTKWLGRAMFRLDFRDKRRIGRGIEYHLKPEIVKDMAERMGVDPIGPEPPKPQETGAPNLQENLEKLVKAARREAEQDGGVFKKFVLWEICSNAYGWTAEEFDKLLSHLERDGIITPTTGNSWRVIA